MRIARRRLLGPLLAAQMLAPALLAAPALARSARFAAAARYAAERRGAALLVLREGRTLFEATTDAGAPGQAFEIWSGTKSFCGPMLAAAAADGLLRPDAPCAEVLPEWRGDPARAAITPLDLLTLTAGFRGGGLRPPGYAEAVGERPVTAPGARFAYGPVPFQIFGEMLRRRLAATGRPPDPLAYLQARLLDPIGIAPGGWRRGRDGNPLLPQGAAFAARAWGRFGEAMLRAESEPGPGLDRRVMARLFRGTRANPGYGLTWWLAEPGLIPPGPRADPGPVGAPDLAAERIVFAAGGGDQRLYLWRRRRVVVVRQATGGLLPGRRGPGWTDATFLRLLADAL